jgi:UDP-hydrolysing UDP-N-acetyl-D-glucosamine 2-epimerase
MHRVCFVTGTRAEFGLMRSALDAIRAHRGLRLQIVATGMHLDHARGRTVEGIDADAIVKWRGQSLAAATGNAIAELSSVFRKLKTDIVLVVGDRVEAFAGAAAGSLSGLAVAHVHGGDRAMGQVDDALRHAITKLAHVHFPATNQSAQRINRLGEQKWRIHQVGSPGIDGIQRIAASREKIVEVVHGKYALAILHPISADDALEQRRANDLLSATFSAGIPRVVVIYPNNDPGSGGILLAWKIAATDPRVTAISNLPRELFLGLLRDAAVLVGNSSSGIIEAASFGTPVINVGDRQLGRQCASDVRHVSYQRREIAAAVSIIWNNGRPRRARSPNPYGGSGTGRKIADILGRLQINDKLLRKLIAY